MPVYDTEGGWLHPPAEELVGGAVAARDAGLRGVKLKIGRLGVDEDAERVDGGLCGAGCGRFTPAARAAPLRPRVP